MTENHTPFRQRYILTIEDGQQHLHPITEDSMLVTVERLPERIGILLPGYSLRKRTKPEQFLRKWYYKLYAHPKFQRNYNKFLEKVRADNIKNNPHYQFKED